MLKLANRDSLSLRYVNGRLLLLDQTLLPHEERWLTVESLEQMVECIQELRVRGAPLIGVAASMMLAHLALEGASFREILGAALRLRESRPTAVNLMNALDRMLAQLSEDHYREQLVERAGGLFDEDVRLCKEMARNGAHLIEDGDSILTHCNTGGLATVGVGTALGVIREAHESGKNIHVYVDETRPLLQGGRLTTWELGQLKIPYTLISDNMAGTLMRKKRIDKVFVGSDRIARNGDFANKIGTYSVAVLAHHHRVPFYVVAPFTTVDLNCASGAEIPIEERTPHEVRGVSGSFGKCVWSPLDAPVFNPAFDVTPAEMLTALVLDRGVFTPVEWCQGVWN